MSRRLILVKLDLWGENMRKSRLGNLYKSLVAMTLGLATFSPVPSNAVTFGNPVDDPLVTAPYVVSIWASEKGDVREAEFICSGTLISPTIILTAAHCTEYSTVSFFVKIKAVALQEETQFYAATPWTGTRYDPGTRAKPPEGDIGLLKINAKITDVSFPSLATPTIAKLITTKTRLTLMGWGLDQNKKLADTLRYSNLSLQDSSSQKYWGKFFNNKTMISAGKYIKAEKKWSGSCNGDSGGPLLAKLNGINYIVGVASWGAQGCRVEAPSVFSRVSYYEKDIRSGIKAVGLLADKVNRLAPVEVIAPVMQGEGIPGSTLICNAGTWENVDKVEISWLSPSRMVGSNIPSTKIIAADAGLEFKCKVLASSKSGDSEATVTRTLTKVLPKKLTVASSPVIGGLEGSDFIKVGSVARCEGWNWAEPVDKEVIQWFTTSTGVVTTPVNGKFIGTGVELPITAEFLKNERGRYLVCQLTGSREGFPSYLVAVKLILTPSAPVINDVIVKSSGLKSGSNATCTYTGGNSQALATYEWGYTGAGNTFTPFGGQTADFIQITPQIIRTASSQKLACRVTISFQGETSNRVGNSVDIFESALEVPKVSLSIPNSLYVGSNASCSIPPSSKYTSTTFEWGISNSSQSINFINGVIGRGGSYTFDRDTLLRSAGSYLVCVATVENEFSKSQGSSSALIPISAAPALPNLTSFSIASQTKSNGNVSAVLSIPSIFGYEQANMEVRLRISGATCDGTQIFTFPSTVTCGGLAGNRNYSGYLEIRYSANPLLAGKQSPATSFTTIDATEAPVISLSNPIQSITAGTPILIATPTNSGGATSASGYSISPSLPSGLSFNTSTGSISGTPTQSQSQRSYTVTASGAGGTSTATFTLTVVAAETTPVISLANSVQSVTVGNPILPVNVTNTGGRINANGYSISPALPSGLVFNANTGAISGTPTQIQIEQIYVLTATGIAGTSSATFRLSVSAPVFAPSISISNSVQSVTVGNAIVTVNPVNSGGAINSNGYSISPTLPAGLTLNASTGSVSGIPISIQAQTNYTITAQGLGGTSTVVLTLTVTDIKAPVLVPNSAVLFARLYASDSTQAVTFRATDSVGVSDAFIQVFNSANTLMGTYAANRVSGTSFDGTYASAFYYDPIFYPSGTYQVKVRLGNVASKVLEWQLIGSIQIVAPADTQSPVVVQNSAVFSSPNVKLGGSIDVSFQATDNRGVNATVIALIDGDGNSLAWVGGTLVSGLAINGTFKGTLGIPTNFKPGGYLVCALAIDAANLRSASQCGSRAEYVQIGVIEVVDANSIYVLTGWEVSGLNGHTVGVGRGLNFEIKTLDRSNTFLASVVAKSESGSPDIIASRFWKSRSEQPGTRYPDNWQTLFEIPSNVIPKSLYKIYWTINLGNGNTGTYVGGDFVITG
jgi:V8-like Glu-specific endopeptidase